ncbi:MAG: TetR/AcrR family transcriptional regulator [Flavobacteriales bacterium]|nr:TetR/AcrR family transcriptional regulator [Flavobacteriales bacterium]
MGRKSIEKERKQLNAKQKRWLANSMPFFYSKGIQGPTMNDIAEHLNLSKATIYNYYESKDDLVHDALWLKLKELDKFRDLLEDESKDFVERYFEGVQYCGECLAGMSEIYLNDLKTHYPKSWSSVELYYQKSVVNLKIYYEKGIERGIFRPFNTNLMATFDLRFFSMMVDANFLISNRIRIEDAFSEYFNTKFNGILTKRDLAILTNFQKN